MWTTEHTVVTNAAREAVWKTWADVENWPRWDKGLEWCRINGEFKTGTTYTLKPVGGPQAKSVITDCQPLKRFADVTKLPLAKMEFVHELKQETDGLHVTHRVTISGPLSFLFAQVIGKDTARDLPETMGNLVQVAKGVQMNNHHYWVIVASKNHVQHGVQKGIAQANHGKAAPLKRMQVGDGILYYSPKTEFEGNEKLQAFTAIGRVRDDEIYRVDMGGGFIPYRRNVEYFDCIDVPIQPLVADLTFIVNKQSWGYQFRFGFFEIPEIDFDLIAGKMLMEKLIHA